MYYIYLFNLKKMFSNHKARNPLGDEAARHLAEILKCNSSLAMLEIRLKLFIAFFFEFFAQKITNKTKKDTIGLTDEGAKQ